MSLVEVWAAKRLVDMFRSKLINGIYNTNVSISIHTPPSTRSQRIWSVMAGRDEITFTQSWHSWPLYFLPSYTVIAGNTPWWISFCIGLLENRKRLPKSVRACVSFSANFLKKALSQDLFFLLTYNTCRIVVYFTF